MIMPMIFTESDTTQPGFDHILDYLRRDGAVVTRESYLDYNYPDGVPDPFPAELESMMPIEFRWKISPLGEKP
jgi:hypothetical protein